MAFGDAPTPAGLRSLITRWAPADVRPAAYPAELPFLAGREAHTAEYVPTRLTDPAGYAGAAGRLARWNFAVAAARDSALTRVHAASTADGWRRVTAVTDAPAGTDTGAVRYARPGETRTVTARRSETTLPMPGHTLDARWYSVEVADRPAGRDDRFGMFHPWWPPQWDPTPGVVVLPGRRRPPGASR